MYGCVENQPNSVPKPSTAYNKAEKDGMIDRIVIMAATSLHLPPLHLPSEF